ncbi:MAG: hypothetical protein LBJ02_03050 [Bifidobacteriaceae bacterium]|jgi:Tfp pilus assembly protein PilX|nr:hypothetical protein [Bifidobacteriaceae bacterium]
MKHLPLGHRQDRNDEGMTMVAVLMGMSLTLVITLGSLGLMSASTKYSRYDQDSELALAAAQSGISDILTELRVDPTYLDSVEATKDDPNGYCQKEAAGGPAAEGDVFAHDCGWAPDKKAGWQTLGGAEGGAYQRYHYAITEREDMAASFVVVSTGRSRDVYRSIEARLTREMTTMWLYFSNYGMTDPSNYETYNLDGAYPGAGKLTSEACGGGWSVGSDLAYSWQLAPSDPNSTKPPREYMSDGKSKDCVQGYWIDGITLDGPVHSNDTLYSAGGRFGGPFSTANPSCRSAKAEAPSTWNKCLQSGGYGDWAGPPPQYREVLQPPPVGTAKQMALDGTGCLYQGPTRIILDGEYMKVWSKETTTERPNCGTMAELKSKAGARVPIPTNSLIFVDAAEGVAPKKIKVGAIGGEPGRELPLGSYTGAAPSAGAQYTQEVTMAHTNKADGVGNLWLEGHMTGGRLTIATDRSAILTGDLLTDDDESDLLGVIAGDAIEIYNPVIQTVKANAAGTGWLAGTMPSPLLPSYRDQWPTDYDLDRSVFRIEAALHVVTAGFSVQNFKVSAVLGTIELFGSLAQNFSGPTGQFEWGPGNVPVPTGGYSEEFVYNTNLTEGPPLLFPSIVNGNWVIAHQAKTEPLKDIKLPLPRRPGSSSQIPSARVPDAVRAPSVTEGGRTR